ncbi:MAG: alanine racemase [Desulfosarcina sp.]|nr:alanine racemase [Desulfosarcina sp.]MBC2767661.1 alanine racemase [Desulfosarcina sp.]
MESKILQSTASLPTPFLIMEEEIVKRNIRRIKDYADHYGFAVRPHTKTHKSLRLARMQLDSGAIGLAVAKVAEAEVMAKLDPLDLTVAYPAVGITRAERLAKLSLIQKIHVAVDSEYHLNELSNEAVKHGTTIGIHVMFDAGLHRCGTADPGQIVRLAQCAEKHAGLRFDGVQMYLGHLYGDAARDPQHFKQINRLWTPVYEALCTAGLAPETISSGSTPSLFDTHRVRYVNEIRVGTAVLNDYFVLKFNHCTLNDCAARVVATVVSDAAAGRVIIDAGSKALSAKQLLRHENFEMGYIVEYPDARLFRLHEEHGWVDVSRCGPPRTGDRLSIIPVNVSLCVNLYDHFYLITRNGRLQKERVDARGCLC